MEIWVANSLEKIFFNTRKPSRASRRIELACARNETEDAQIVVRSNENIERLSVEFSDLKRSGKRLTVDHISAQFVWCVPVIHNTRDNGNGRYIIRNAPDFFPDALVSLPEISVEKNRAQSIWISVRVPGDASPGSYKGKIKVSVDRRDVDIPITVQVHPFEIPQQPSLFMTNWLSIESLEHFFNVKRFSEEWWGLIDKVAANMAAHRQNVILTPFQKLVRFVKTEIGFRAEFSQLDRWIETFLNHGVAELIEGTHLAGRSEDLESELSFLPFTIYNSDGGQHLLPSVSVKDEDRQYLVRVFMSQIYEHLDERGWAARLVQHLADEPVEANADSYRYLSEFIRGVLPTVTRIDAVMNNGLEGAVDIRVPQIQEIDDDIENRPANEQLWFYTCLAPQGPHPNRFIDFSSLKTRIIHWMNWRYQATGYLHWGYNYWRQWQGSEFCNPYYTATGESERLATGMTPLPPGDPCIVYPGEGDVNNSIRWEMVRKGMEDYEYLKILEERIASTKPSRPAVKKGLQVLDHVRNKVVPSHTKYVNSDENFLKARSELTKAILGFGKKR